MQAIEAEPGAGATTTLDLPLCESTGFEANEPNCQWEAGYSVCGSTFETCEQAGPLVGFGLRYSTTCDPPTGEVPEPDNCCVTKPNPGTGWYMSITSQHCDEPHIDTANPASGNQHLRFTRNLEGGYPPGCAYYSNECRVMAFTPNVNVHAPIPMPRAVTITSFDIARRVPMAGSNQELIWANQSISEDAVAQLIRFDAYGYVTAYDYDWSWYVPLGYLSADGRYYNISTRYDACSETQQYFFEGELVHQNITRGVRGIEQAYWLYNNIGGPFDVDNYSVIREAPCSPACGDDFLDFPLEECDASEEGGDVCCPGQCAAGGEEDQCTCRREHTIDSADPREITNGENGPFLTDGGFYVYTADAASTSIDTCGSDYDTELFWNWDPDSNDYEVYNNDCSDDPLLAHSQGPANPHASCYQATGFPGSSCLCVQTVPGESYTFVVAGHGSAFFPPACSQTVINIQKKIDCQTGVIAGGACCDTRTAVCTDGVAPEACAGPFQIYSPNKLCAMVSCEPIEGACCNRAPGAGGACSQTIRSDCIASLMTWTPAAGCAAVACAEIRGACCDGLTSSCADGLLADCVCPLCAWTLGTSCDFEPCELASGACCVEPSTIEAFCVDDRTIHECNAAGGTWTRDSLCTNVTCDPNFLPIPTVSEWGLVILCLVLLVAEKMYSRRAFGGGAAE